MPAASLQASGTGSDGSRARGEGRIGAFEVQIAYKPASNNESNPIVETLHSKINTSRWVVRYLPPATIPFLVCVIPLVDMLPSQSASLLLHFLL
jgi:hypothetical protein